MNKNFLLYSGVGTIMAGVIGLWVYGVQTRVTLDEETTSSPSELQTTLLDFKSAFGDTLSSIKELKNTIERIAPTSSPKTSTTVSTSSIYRLLRNLEQNTTSTVEP